jgi:hypothetical protein
MGQKEGITMAEKVLQVRIVFNDETKQEAVDAFVEHVQAELNFADVTAVVFVEEVEAEDGEA